MPFQPIASTVECVLSAERNGEERKNVIHYRYSGALPSAVEMTDLADEIANGIINAQAMFSCIGTNWIQVKVSEMSTAGGLVVDHAIFHAGTAGGGVLPGNSSHCLTKRSSFRGGSFRGRFYLFDLQESYFNGDDVELPLLPYITNLANEIIQPRVGGRFLPAIGSRKLAASTLFTAVTFDLVADSQRRRLKKRGR